MQDSIFGCAGVLIGAFIQHWCTRRHALESRYLELKSEAYADYINAVATAGFVQESSLSTMREPLAAAKSRICVFGDREVIEAMSRLERTSLSLSNPDARDAFLDLVRIVRAHSIASGILSTEAMTDVLFGVDSTAKSRKAG